MKLSQKKTRFIVRCVGSGARFTPGPIRNGFFIFANCSSETAFYKKNNNQKKIQSLKDFKNLKNSKMCEIVKKFKKFQEFEEFQKFEKIKKCETFKKV